MALKDKRPKTLTPVRPNAGLEAAYRKALDDLVFEMHASIEHWIIAAYRAKTPEMAGDETFSARAIKGRSPAATLDILLKRLARKWRRRFAQAAQPLAEYFSKSVAERTDSSLKGALKKAGFTIKFKMTPAQNDVVQATVAENVRLIKSIAEQHLTEVQGLVMRSVTTGRDVGGVTEALQERFGVTKRRAALIAHTANNQATATLQRVRQTEIGITQAVWIHAGAGKHPRPSHLAMNGKVYDVSEGMWDEHEQRHVLPGELINCRCLSKPVIPGIRGGAPSEEDQHRGEAEIDEMRQAEKGRNRA